MKKSRQSRAGNTVVEFTLVGIPLIFVLISIFEISRGMWIYHTLAHAVREGTRYAIVHGQNCATAPNVCQVSISQIAQRIRDAGVGLDPDQLSVTFVNASGPNPLNTVGPATLTSHLGNATIWPPPPGNAVGSDVIVTAVFPFRSAIAMLWPGAGRPINFGVFNLPASSRDKIQF